MSYAAEHLAEAAKVLSQLDAALVERAAEVLVQGKKSGGRLFILGVGGSAANASHAVNDFRKIAGFEAYAPTDNVAELTARTNDDGWESVFVEWLKVSRLQAKDTVLVFSVGGGNREKKVSVNLVLALEHAKAIGCKIISVVGRSSGAAAKMSDVCVLIPEVNAARVTPHTEAFQALVWHLWVSHPLLKGENDHARNNDKI